MILRSTGSRILTDNVALLFDFYTEKLGFKVVWGDRESVYVSFSEADNDKPLLSLFAKNCMSAYKGYDPQNGKADNIVLCMFSENLDADYDMLKSRGVEFLSDPQTIEEWYMRCVYLRDPEGNLIEISANIT